MEGRKGRTSRNVNGGLTDSQVYQTSCQPPLAGRITPSRSRTICVVRAGYLPRDVFFRELYSEAPVSMEDRARLLGQTGAVGDVTLEVLELTGSAGDAYFTGLRVLHTGAPNAGDHPRIMATHRFVRADVMQELTEARGGSDPGRLGSPFRS
jgi:hypothetical protein